MRSPYEPPRSDAAASSLRSTRKYHVAVIISGIFGVLGVHHFYLGRWLLGFVDIGLALVAFTAFVNEHVAVAVAIFAIDAVHSLFTTVQLLVGAYRDGDGKLVCYPGQRIPGENVAG